MRVPAFCALSITLCGLGACAGTRQHTTTAAAPAGDRVPVAKDESQPSSDSSIVKPDWLQRLQTSTQHNAVGEPDVSLKSVQPLLQSGDRSDTLFADIRADGAESAGAVNARSNVGLGYRRLIDKDFLAGVGGFYDRDWTETSARASTEAQLKWKTIDLNAGYYAAIDSAVDGYQVGMAAPLPYLPWARTSLSGTTFFGKEEQTTRSANMQIGLLKHLKLDGGVTSTGQSDESGYVKLSFQFDGSSSGLKRYLFSRNPVAAVPFESRDLTGSTLDAIPHSEVIQRDG
jgi:hypothetical protein